MATVIRLVRPYACFEGPDNTYVDEFYEYRTLEEAFDDVVEMIRGDLLDGYTLRYSSPLYMTPHFYNVDSIGAHYRVFDLYGTIEYIVLFKH